MGNRTEKLYMYNAEALRRLEQKVVAAGRPIPQGFRKFTSVQPPSCSSSEDDQNHAEAEGPTGARERSRNSTETPRNNVQDSAMQDGEVSSGRSESNEEPEDNFNGSNTETSPEERNSDGSYQSASQGSHATSPQERNSDSGEDGNNTDNNTETPRNPLENFAQEEAIIRRQFQNRTDIQRLAIDVAGVRGSSRASDSSIDKVFDAVFKHMETVRNLRRKGKKTYSKFLRRIALKYAPVVTTDLLLEEKTPAGGVEYHRVEGLKAIPEEYRSLHNRGQMRIIREESSVSLPQIKAHHEKIHVQQGMSLETIRKQYGNCMLSLDGVEESKSGQKKFHVASIKIGECIYPFKIYDYVMGHDAAKISTHTILG